MIKELEISNLIDNFQAYTNAETTQILLHYARLNHNLHNFQEDKTVYVLVGPSGSGKSTFIANMYSKNIFGNSATSFVPFINRHYANMSLSLNEEISFKTNMLKHGKSFMIESANFDANYADFIKSMKTKYGYNICLLYLTKNNPKENIEMVLKRRREGGHGSASIELNETVLNYMYYIDSYNLVKVMPYCDSCFIIKNPTKNKIDDSKPIVLLQKKLSGEIVYNKDNENAKFLYDRILKSSAKMMIKNAYKIKKLDSVYLSRLSKTKKLTLKAYPYERRIDKIISGIQNLSHEVNKNIGNNASIEKLEYSDNEDNVIVLNNDNEREK